MGEPGAQRAGRRRNRRGGGGWCGSRGHGNFLGFEGGIETSGGGPRIRPFPRHRRPSRGTGRAPGAGGGAGRPSGGVAESAGHLVWIDCEMTGLELNRDKLIEVAVLITDSDRTSWTRGWTSSSPGRCRTRRHERGRRRDAREVGAHRRRPRVDADPRRGRTAATRLHQAVGAGAPDGAAVRQLHRHRPGFLARDMPELDDHLHYRMVDVLGEGAGPPLVPARLLRPAPEGSRPPRAGRHHRVGPGAGVLP